MKVMELLLMRMEMLRRHSVIQAWMLEPIIITKLGHMQLMVDGQAVETKLHQEAIQGQLMKQHQGLQVYLQTQQLVLKKPMSLLMDGYNQMERQILLVIYYSMILMILEVQYLIYPKVLLQTERDLKMTQLERQHLLKVNFTTLTPKQTILQDGMNLVEYKHFLLNQIHLPILQHKQTVRQ